MTDTGEGIVNHGKIEPTLDDMAGNIPGATGTLSGREVTFTARWDRPCIKWRFHSKDERPADKTQWTLYIDSEFIGYLTHESDNVR